MDKTPRVRFLQMTEARIFIAGCCMLMVWIELVAVLLVRGKPLWFNLVKAGLYHLAAGRAASIAYATGTGLKPGLIACLATYMDIMAMFIMYPLLIYGYRNLLERRVFQRHMKPVFDAARRGAVKMRRFKIAGIFLFVWFPFWMTGIITGAVLGYLLGLRTWVNMLTVCLGSATAVVCWVFAYDRLFAWLGGINQQIPVAVTTVIIASLVVLKLLQKRREYLEQEGRTSPDKGDVSDV